MTWYLNVVVMTVLAATLCCSVTSQLDFLQNAIVSVFQTDAEVPVPVSTPPTSEIAITDGQQNCVCVPFNTCGGYESDSDGVNLIDVRINLSPCSSYLDVCCNSTASPTTSCQTPAADRDRDNSNGNGGDAQEPVTPQQAQETQDYTAAPVYENNTDGTQSPDVGNACGTWNRGGVGFRVINAVGGESQYAEYPAMVAVFREENQQLFYHCGGSLIRPNVVLTTAHCVSQKHPSAVVVRAGEWDLQTEKEIFSHQDRRAYRIVVHNEYYAGGLHNDVALIFTEDPFVLQETVKTICLPQQNQQFDHALCYSSGWGKEVTTNNYTVSRIMSGGAVTHEIGHYNVSILKKVELPVVPRDTCENALRGTRLGPKFRLHESFICAGGEDGKDTCKGDGGSPLMCPSIDNPDILIQAGIVAWGIGCGIHQIPAVYVNVAQFRNWIDAEISATANK